MCGLVGAGDEEEVCSEDEAAAGEELLVGAGDAVNAGRGICGLMDGTGNRAFWRPVSRIIPAVFGNLLDLCRRVIIQSP